MISTNTKSQGIRAGEINAYGRRMREAEKTDTATSSDDAATSQRSVSKGKTAKIKGEEDSSMPTAPRRRIPQGASMNFEEEDDADEDDFDEPPVKRVAKEEEVRPGEGANCGVCGTRFSMTRYTCVCTGTRSDDSRIEPMVGALCYKCNKAVPRTQTPRRNQVRADSRALGPRPARNIVEAKIELPSLQTLCINVCDLRACSPQIVAEWIDNIKALGSLSDRNMAAISRVRGT